MLKKLFVFVDNYLLLVNLFFFVLHGNSDFANSRFCTQCMFCF